VFDQISAFPNAERPIRVTSSVPARQGKKTDEGTMMLSSAHESNPSAVVEPPQMQILMPATTKEASDILINCKTEFYEVIQELIGSICPATYGLLLAARPVARRLRSSQRGCHCFVLTAPSVSVVRLRPLMIVVTNESRIEGQMR
jgi:hypothetical protein